MGYLGLQIYKFINLWKIFVPNSSLRVFTQTEDFSISELTTLHSSFSLLLFEKVRGHSVYI